MSRHNQNKQYGFSLIELLIVVAIILIIAAIAIPNLLRARIAANESSAAAGIRTINTGEVSFFSSFQTYAPLLTNLGPGGAATACPAPPTSIASCFIDGQLASGSKSGYTYSAVGTATTYVALGNATTLSSTGVRGFCSFEDAVVRVKNPGPIAAAACIGSLSALQ